MTAPIRFCPNTNLGSLDISPNLNGPSVLELKENIFSVLDLISSVLENNAFGVVICDSVDPGVDNVPNFGVLGVVTGDEPNKLVDLVSSVLIEFVEKPPKIGLDPKRDAFEVVFSNKLVEDLSPNRKDVEGLKGCGELFVDIIKESFDPVIQTDDVSCFLSLSFS